MRDGGQGHDTNLLTCVKVLRRVVIILLLVRDGLGKLLLHLGARDTVRFQEGVEVRHNQAFYVEVAANSTILNALDCCGDTTQDPQFVTSIEKFPTLDIGHLEAQLMDEAVVQQGGGRGVETRGDQGHKEPPLTAEHVVLVVGAVGEGRRENAVIGVVFSEHHWFETTKYI